MQLRKLFHHHLLFPGTTKNAIGSHSEPASPSILLTELDGRTVLQRKVRGNPLYEQKKRPHNPINS